MIEIYKQLVTNQFEATLCTLYTYIHRCPEEAWDAPVANLKFCQAAFHTLFYTDLYLGPDVESQRQQEFHQQRQAMFRDYEELEDRPQVLLYERPDIKAYLDHCREKAGRVIAAETAESLAGPTGFPWLKFTRAELHVYSIRHIQHHAAQLSLRLRLDWGMDVRWIGSGWREE